MTLMLHYSHVAGVIITPGILAALGIEPSAVGLCVQGPPLILQGLFVTPIVFLLRQKLVKCLVVLVAKC